jgi:hypothetical protein
MGMRGFAGIAPSPSPSPAPAPAPRFPSTEVDEDLAAQLARINAEAMADTPPAPPPEKRGGIFGRLTGNRSAPPPPPSDIGMGDASMDEGSMADTGLGNGAMEDATMGDAAMGFDAALAEQALPGEKAPRKKPPVVAIGWLILALIVGGVVATLALAPSAVMSVLPGAARLYALFGMPVGAQGLAFEGVRYGWTSNGGQTVLEVQGDVVNRTSSPVNVPTVVIALRDEGGAEISEWTTEIGAEELGAGEHAPFLRQIPSPPSNVRSVKVRFAKAE